MKRHLKLHMKFCSDNSQRKFALAFSIQIIFQIPGAIERRHFDAKEVGHESHTT